MKYLDSSFKNTLKLLRIPFSLFLIPIFLLAVSQCADINWSYTIIVFLIIHLLIYPASNGYNSYIDKDETPIGGLEKPPMPTKQLFYVTLVLDVMALILSAILLNPLFAIYVAIYILVSRAYSSKQIRLKKYPIMGFLTVVIFQGAFTYFMVYEGISNQNLNLHNAFFILLASTFQIAGAYPLTQIYQHKADADNGDYTLSYKLGYIGTFIFTAFMFICCNICYYIYFANINSLNQFFILQLFFLPTLIYFSWWFMRVKLNTINANFKNTMRMNIIASISMSACFLSFIIFRFI